MDGCKKFVQYGHIVINCFLFIFGAIAAGIGIWMLVERSFSNELLGTNLYSGSAYSIAICGTLAVILSSLLCIGPMRRFRCTIVCRGIPLAIICFVVVIASVIALVFIGKAQKTIRFEMQRSLSEYGRIHEVTKAWDETQSRLFCCGIYDYTDWQDRIPESCCKVTSNGQRINCRQVEVKNDFTIYKRGCMSVTKDYVTDNATWLSVAGFVLSAFLLLGVISSCAMFKLVD